MPEKRHICPNNCGDEFITTAHVVQDWKVDGLERNVFIVDISMDKLKEGDYKDNIAIFGEEQI